MDSTVGPYHDDISYLLFYTLMGPLFVVGLVGNSLFIIIIVFHTKMRTVPNKYICNLSAANLLTILAAALGPALDNEQSVGGVPWVCGGTQLLHEVGSCAALFTLVALGAERFHAARWPLHKNTITGCVLLVVWFISFAVSMGEFHVTGDPFHCTRAGATFNLRVVLGKSSLFGFLVAYVIPLTVIFIFFVLTVREAFLAVRSPIELRDLHEKSSSMENISERLHEVKKKVVWVVLVLVVTFAVCFLPFYAISLIITTSPERRAGLARALNIFFMLTDIFACVNPIILYSMSKSCRKHIRQYLFRCSPWSLGYPQDDRSRRSHNDLASINRPTLGKSLSVNTTTL